MEEDCTAEVEADSGVEEVDHSRMVGESLVHSRGHHPGRLHKAQEEAEIRPVGHLEDQNWTLVAVQEQERSHLEADREGPEERQE